MTQRVLILGNDKSILPGSQAKPPMPLMIPTSQVTVRHQAAVLRMEQRQNPSTYASLIHALAETVSPLVL